MESLDLIPEICNAYDCMMASISDSSQGNSDLGSVYDF